MDQKKVILVDMDDTICELVKGCIYHHNKRWPDHALEYSAMVSWDLTNVWHPDCNAKEFFGVPGLFEDLEIMDEHVVKEMRKLHEDYEVLIVTASWPTSVLEKWNWLQKHLPFIPHDNFITAKKKYLIDGDLMIDDAVHNLLPFAEKGKKVIGIPRPWNSDIRDQVLFKDNGWEGMKAFVDTLFDPETGKEDNENETLLALFPPT